MNNQCFMFGHRNAPLWISKLITKEILYLYEHHSIKCYIVGYHGNFDIAATTAVLEAKKQYKEIKLILLSPYHPETVQIYDPDIYDEMIYPPLEHTPNKFAITNANKFMVNNSSHIICYTDQTGNSGKLLKIASKRNISVINLF